MTSHSLRTTARSFVQAQSRSRSLLLTFDAFDTLFHPRQPVPEQYVLTANEFGLSGSALTPQKFKAAFKHVFHKQVTLYPNYGRADVLCGKYGGPRQWWEEVIRRSFTHALSADSTQKSDIENTHLPDGLVDALLNRFAGAEGYMLYPDVAPFFARMREFRASQVKGGRFNNVIIGVISNSDDRVPAVLKALGLRVSDMRADQDRSSVELPGFEERSTEKESGTQESIPSIANQYSRPDSGNDLDLIITSYEAGAEKPNRLIFDVARRQALLMALDGENFPRGTPTNLDEHGAWTCVHVGDDYQKDYIGAIDAGWQSYWLPRGNGQHSPANKISSLMDLIHELELGS
ncbi:hypothetical protein N7495_009683 [Penicillium taxi]|uniref:uncharacterized protein n=1 Tax=Penicillium taxi TaxID=168475 RepID=UPI0025454CAD|nr:uncharacterized protein N7495_009683 [Penicillium taxi]KAJ5885173.1 hypothetical protein N7495_009683 [Penicillium taxi]